jgi:hypothetical protein
MGSDYTPLRYVNEGDGLLHQLAHAYHHPETKQKQQQCHAGIQA